MKTVAAEICLFPARPGTKKNLKLLIVYCCFLFTMVLVYAMCVPSSHVVSWRGWSIPSLPESTGPLRS